jgi:hypothetical protein
MLKRVLVVVRSCEITQSEEYAEEASQMVGRIKKVTRLLSRITPDSLFQPGFLHHSITQTTRVSQ